MGTSSSARERTSRRVFLAGAAVALGGVAAEAVAGAIPARATDGDPITVGGSFEGTGSTTLHTTGTGQTTALRGVNDGSQAGYGLDGEAHSTDGYGVHGRAYGDQGIGVVGESFYQFGANGTGVMGWARHLTGETKGVWGLCESPLGTGVVGSGGTGVSGSGSVGVLGAASSSTGVGVLAENPLGGVGLGVTGRAMFDRSGRVTITFPNKSATVPVPGGLSTSSLALAVLQSVLSGVYVTAATLNIAAKTLTIYMNKAPGSASKPKSVDVGWFVVN